MGAPTIIEDARNATETFLLILPSFLYLVISTVIPAYLKKPRKLYVCAIEFLVIVIPIILDVTVLSTFKTNSLFSIGLFSLEVLVLFLLYFCFKPTSNFLVKQANIYEKPYITNARATINLISVVAILAVDFQIFPVRFSKTSKTGFSLMDLGVGLYVFANGIVAPETKGKKDPIKRSIKSSAMLILIGLLRLFFTKAANYNVLEHEYGTHWNFFITLAVTKIVTSCILNVFDTNYVLINAVLLTLSYETLLQIFLKSWVFSNAKRTNIISANREGLVSSIGYICLYLYSLYFSYSFNRFKQKRQNVNSFFFIWLIASFGCTCFCTVNLEVSRRLANTGYIAWILFIAIFMTWLFYLWDITVTKILKSKSLRRSPYLYEAINYNSLMFFIIGNILTGLVNFSISTNQVTSINSLLIISMYMIVNCSIVLILYFSQYKIKLC